MKLILEADGPILDVGPAYWHAYAAALSELNLPKTDPDTFWRLVRRGAAPGEYIRGAKTQHIQTFATRFAALIESDEAVAQCRPQPDVADALRRITEHGECSLITVGRNRGARQQILSQHDLTVHFLRMMGLFGDPTRRPKQLCELAGDSRRAVVVAASTEVVRAAVRAELIAVGIAQGNCSANRLTQTGAALIFADLDALADDLDHGADRLSKAGLLPAPPRPNASPFVTPNHERKRSARSNRFYKDRRR